MIAQTSVGRPPQPKGFLDMFGLGSLFGLGSGCPVNANGTCDYNGMEISCSMIRECDSQTGAVHYEYTMPYDTGNVNINVANPATQQIVGYENAQGQFVDTPDVAIPVYEQQQAAIAQGVPNVPVTTGQPINPATLLYPSGNTISYVAPQAQEQTTIAPPTTLNSQTQVTPSSNTTNLTNTPQTVVNQQGAPKNASLTNINTGDLKTGITDAMQNFGDLLSQGTSWLDDESFGINNQTLLVLGALGVAGVYFGMNKKGRR